ncbi:MAG: hypothetical protein KAV87_36960, partial [Desulfobacteraceae bacterium]|nr:hypothetical protein [Desulfobacteraceae bacterium]
MASKNGYITSTIIVLLILALTPALAFSEQLTQTHGTLQKTAGVGSWGYDTGWLGFDVGIGAYVRAGLELGGEFFTVEEDGQVKLETGDSEMWFNGTNGYIYQNFGIAFGVEAKLVIWGVEYPIDIPYVGWTDFILEDDVSFTPYSLNQTQQLQASIPRQELVCAEIGIPWVASGGVCLDGAAGNHFWFTGQQIQTSKGNITSNGQHKNVTLSCSSPTFTVTSIRKQWGFSGTVTVSGYVVFQVTVFGIQYEIPITLIDDYPLPLDQWLTSSFTTHPARTVSFTIPCRQLSLYKQGNGQIRVNGSTKNLPWSGSFVKDQWVDLEALPAYCYSFDYWTGALSGPWPARDIQMTTNKSATAVFEFQGVGQPDISGLPSNVCGGIQYSLSAPASGATSYSWSSSCGGSFSSPNSSNTTWTAPMGHTGLCTITVEASNSCDSKSDNASTNVKQKPGTPSIAGQYEVCGGVSEQYTASASGSPTGWSWTDGCDGTFSPQNGNPTTWTPPTGYTGSCQISVTASNSCGPSNPGSKPVDVKQKPGSPLISGPSDVCGGVGEQYTASASGGPTGWSWTSGCGGTFNPQNGNPTTWTPPTTHTGSCQISVIASNSCGSSNPGSKSVNVKQKPEPPSLVIPLNGDTIYVLSVYLDWTDISGADYYQVQVDNNSSFSSPEIDAQTSSSNYSASGLADLTQYHWRVRAHNSC